MRILTRKYIPKKKFWSSEMNRPEKEMSKKDREVRSDRDRRLLVATRASSVMGSASGHRHYKQTLNKIERNGGTAGGKKRRRRSIVCIPVQDPTCLSPKTDCGGVFIANTLEEHY